MNSVESWNTPRVIEAISCLELLQHGQVTHLSLQAITWDNAIHESPFFAPFLYRLQNLNIGGRRARQVLNVLPSFHELRKLALSRVDVPPLASEVDLPLVHTLQTLSLRESTISWIDGLVFTQLQSFTVNGCHWPKTFKRKVGMPACTHILFGRDTVEGLPVLQSDFQLPLLDTFELVSAWHYEDETKIKALQHIHAKSLKFYIFTFSPSFLESLEFKDEVEQLILVIFIQSVAMQEMLTGFSVTNPITKRVPCPNMKVLRLQFDGVTGAKREQVGQLCRQMMNNRRLAGYSLETCYIWWDENEWEEAAPLILVMENAEVRIEGSL